MCDTLVIGLGSPLMGDDGLGIVAAQRVHDEWTFAPAVEFVDGGTWGMNLLPLIESANAVVLVDAIDAGANPGEIVVLERDDLPMFVAAKLSPHQIDLKEVLALAAFRDTLPVQTVAIGLQPAVIEMSAELSEPVTSAMDGLCSRVVDRLAAWGHAATPSSVEAHA